MLLNTLIVKEGLTLICICLFEKVVNDDLKDQNHIIWRWWF